MATKVLTLVDAAPIDQLLGGETGTLGANSHDLGWFGLVRYDQMSRLRDRIKDINPSPGGVSMEDFALFLKDFGKELASADWRRSTVGSDAEKRDEIFKHYTKLRQAQRLDYSRVRVVKTSIASTDLPSGIEPIAHEIPGQEYFCRVSRTEDDLQAWASSLGLCLDPTGLLSKLTE